MIFPENSFIISLSFYRSKQTKKSPMGLISLFKSGSMPGDPDYIAIIFGVPKTYSKRYPEVAPLRHPKNHLRIPKDHLHLFPPGKNLGHGALQIVHQLSEEQEGYCQASKLGMRVFWRYLRYFMPTS